MQAENNNITEEGKECAKNFGEVSMQTTICQFSSEAIRLVLLGFCCI